MKTSVESELVKAGMDFMDLRTDLHFDTPGGVLTHARPGLKTVNGRRRVLEAVSSFLSFFNSSCLMIFSDGCERQNPTNAQCGDSLGNNSQRPNFRERNRSRRDLYFSRWLH
jgi:hypothetical protein